MATKIAFNGLVRASDDQRDQRVDPVTGKPVKLGGASAQAITSGSMSAARAKAGSVENNGTQAVATLEASTPQNSYTQRGRKGMSYRARSRSAKTV